MGLGSAISVLFLIGVLALVLIMTMNTVAEAFPVVALGVVVFCLVMLAVLIVLVLKGNNDNE